MSGDGTQQQWREANLLREGTTRTTAKTSAHRAPKERRARRQTDNTSELTTSKLRTTNWEQPASTAGGRIVANFVRGFFEVFS
jgi:hypothetical protein